MVKITRRQVTFVIGILFTVNTVLAKYDECGKRKDHFSRKIIGGNVSQPGLWPWHVGMKRKNAEGNWKNFCGGALIDSQWLLTAAHCFYVRFVSGGKWLPKKSINPLKKFKIIAGDHITDRNEPTEQERTPLEIHIHPDYRYHPNSENDIALIKLNRKVILGPNVRTVCLPGKDFAKPGHYCFATGWGMTESGRPSSVLRHSRHMIQKNEICNRTTKPGYYNETVMFCAGDGKGHSDTCEGDSGGSVVRRVLVKGQYRWVTIGIVSWGEGCAVPGKYGYYTRLQPFMEWILRTKDSLCANPGPLLNGVGKPNKRHYRRNDKVMYQCNVGYTRTGRSVLSCQGDDKWDGHKPLCLAPCSDPGVPKHGVRLDHDFKHGQSVRFRCKKGSQLIGESYITCDNGRWDNDSPICSVSCPDVGHPINGLRKPNKKMYFKETVTFECKKDYTMLGKSLLYCQGNGKWNGYKPICFAPCRSPLVPQNVIRLDNSFTHGKSTRFKCKNGYQMIGGSKTTCINGRWNRNPPTCLAPCSNPGIPFNGNRLDRSFLHGHQVRFSCDDGFTLIGEHTITCNNGRWNNTTPNCLAPCSNPGQIPNALKIGNDFSHGKTIRYQCFPDYSLHGSGLLRCNNGYWSHPKPTCKGSCSDPGFPLNGIKSGDSFQHGEYITYKCLRGYRLVGSSRLSCNDGTWSSEIPKCFGNCLHPGFIRNGWISGPNFRIFLHNQKISFICQNGYRIKGARKMKCNNGKWSDKLPTCIGLCPPVISPRNGELLGNNFESGATVRFRCNNGYTLRGPHNIICQDRIWSHKVPVCKADCRDPGVPRNGHRHGDVFSHNSVVNFTCNNASLLVGATSILCTDGIWSNRKPDCEAKCKEPGSPSNATKLIGVSKEGRQTVSFRCLFPMTLVGKNVLTCYQGSWSHNLPSCSDCGSSLGMENRKIPDVNIRASSYKDRYRRPRYGRLNGPRAWCSGREYGLPHLEIDLGKPYRITNLATQGSERDKSWVKQYIVAHTLARSSFISYRENGKEKVFEANKDETSVAWNRLNMPLIARKVRFYPTKWTGSNNPACMRVEIYGCDIPTDCVMTGSRVLEKDGVAYFRSYVKTITRDIVELEDFNQYKRVKKTSIVLGVRPKQNELQKGTKVLVRKIDKYYAVKITDVINKYYYVKGNDFVEKWVYIDELRLPKNVSFCEGQ